ncbi:hypothetical protein SH601_02015 [Gracilibacillus sp. S3-1-1]|uniref:Uncharacterized protein n=1 Tax=Gracilibacillus pellucidus TaxID=3095368 RepID=A0ACC6M1J5_9BACI|nr:hypothetical protein [Gracilibacillus sp. S3-1-1]MDX8044750.1 hypothetical protein [Gracilibacillus sp. S3-1-1]
MHPIFLHYPIQVPTKQVSEKPYMTFADQSYYYFIIPTNVTERVALELYTIATHYHQQGWTNVTCPIPNVHNQFLTTIGKDTYLLCYGIQREDDRTESIKLADFHQAGFRYPYQPSTINSYGSWKDLWIAKIDQYEGMFKQLYQKRPSTPFLRELVDMFPYIIGLAENAIQYLYLVEQETQFNESDQPSMTFGRYQRDLLDEFIWSDRLIYDHPVRDIAEKMRYFMQTSEGLSSHDSQQFLHGYLTKLPLSIFGWKLLYARLLFPIHLFDFIDQVQHDTISSASIEEFINIQTYYEEHLRTFFYKMGIDVRETNSIQLDWLVDR